MPGVRKQKSFVGYTLPPLAIPSLNKDSVVEIHTTRDK